MDQEQPMGQVEPEPIEPTPPEEERKPAARAQVVRSLDRPPQFERAIVRMSDGVGELVGALALAQLSFGDVEKTLTARVTSRRTGGTYEFDYETLADVIEATRKPLAEQGLVVVQLPFPGERSLTLRTMLMHKSGQWISNDLSCLLDGLDPQSVGSGVTYLMRYSRKAMLGISASREDDDGARASGAKATPPPQPTPRRSEQARAQQEPAELRAEGPISQLEEKGGAWLVRVHELVCATRNSAWTDQLALHQRAGDVVAIVAKPSRDPEKYAATLTAWRVVEREPGAEG